MHLLLVPRISGLRVDQMEFWNLPDVLTKASRNRLRQLPVNLIEDLRQSALFLVAGKLQAQTRGQFAAAPQLQDEVVWLLSYR